LKGLASKFKKLNSIGIYSRRGVVKIGIGLVWLKQKKRGWKFIGPSTVHAFMQALRSDE